LGKDPEVRNLESGVKVTRFPLATTESYRDKSGNRTDHTEWHNIVLWRGLAEIAEKYLQKGNQIYLEGKIQTRQWEDREGNKRYTTEIVGDNMTMLGGRREPNGSPTTSAPQDLAEGEADSPDVNIEAEEDDLPF
ncbi:MAG: single-stranded DNA-binding protein, partial [Bacteroidales bacterium]|nr:single-stranded DNA-binding protein [Bacteroidales bacterium]